jgi:dTDP-4-dehydrorhamnose reductase
LRKLHREHLMTEIWAGLECTVNRVGDRYVDQIVRTGHHHRPADLDLIADLGIKTLRYPVLWERTESDWTWPTERLHRLRELDIDPILGLLHHGSGPRCTSLIDPLFADKFAAYAAAVARKFPWVRRYTPVNEPLTTARFSALYGHWYPHSCNDHDFVYALLNQCRGVVLAMREIRHVNSTACLIQTEDLGKIFSTARLGYQSEFENNRRWLTFDLLFGRVDRHHPLWSYLIYAGAAEAHILWFADNPCPPDILGINHYVTSDRYLDERLDLYPCSVHGRNGRERYADVEAVRVDLQLPLGTEHRLREAWERYGNAMAITEVHLGSNHEDQLLWFGHSWNAATRLAKEGMDLRAVTAWALFGAYDWHCLLTREEGRYECGVFDIRHSPPQRTRLARFLREIALGRASLHAPSWRIGWWQRPERIQYMVENSKELRSPVCLDSR